MTDENTLQPAAEPLLNESEAAAFLSVSVKLMQNWRWRGEGPRFVRLGGRLVRYRRADLEAFVAAGESGKAA